MTLHVYYSSQNKKIIDVFNFVTNKGYVFDEALADVIKDYPDTQILTIEDCLSKLKLDAVSFNELTYNQYLVKQAVASDLINVQGLEYFSLFGECYLEFYLYYNKKYYVMELDRYPVKFKRVDYRKTII